MLGGCTVRVANRLPVLRSVAIAPPNREVGSVSLSRILDRVVFFRQSTLRRSLDFQRVGLERDGRLAAT